VLHKIAEDHLRCPIQFRAEDGSWSRTYNVGACPYTKPEAKPAPATLADCRRVCTGTAIYAQTSEPKTTYGSQAEIVHFDADMLEANDWVYRYIGDSAWISPNGEVFE
jgi:hypothetical protein